MSNTFYSLPPLNRRQLLKTLGVLGLAGAAPGLWAATPRRRLGVALVGLGYYSRDLLAPALQLTQHCYLAGIVTGSPDKIPHWQATYNIPERNVYHYGNMHELANNPDIDVVYVVTPTGLHQHFSVIAANAGKHVWCEKPMAMTASECQTIIDTCRKNKVQLTVGYRMQHEPNTRRLMAMAREKPYGNIRDIIAEAGYRSGSTSHHWRADPKLGGGALYDMGVYPLNAARYTSGEEPIAVSARQETQNPVYAQVGETTWFDLEFPSGAIAKCLTGYDRNLNTLRANCEKGWYELVPFQSYSNVQGRTSDGITLKPSPENQQARQMDNDALAIINNAAPLVPGENGKQDIVILEAVLKAITEKKKVRIG